MAGMALDAGMALKAVRLFVDAEHLAACISFYAGSLGLRLRHDGRQQGFAAFDAGGIDLIVEAVPADAPEEDRVLVARFSGLSFEVSDIAAAHRRLLAQGVSFEGEPERQFWGGILATLVDPAGNRLQIVQYPASAA
jgi:catechol 2,3-dioxygenase-like lactoylglutathione lyase family enzyme